MKEEERSEETQSDQKQKSAVVGRQTGESSKDLIRRIGIYGAVLIAVFLLGLIPMWLTARERANELEAARRELRLARIQNMLASAVIDARRGEYEPARQAASDFFTAARAEIDRGNGSAFNQAQLKGVESLLAQRDELITLLARSDPAAAGPLSDLYVSYRKAVGNGESQSMTG